MAKRTARQIAKDKAWEAFSIYIRTRDCLRFSGNPTDGRCVTCWNEYPFKKLQAGHFIPGRGNAVLFDERLVYTQCIGCNGNPPYGKGGNYIQYFLFMEREWGRPMVDEFIALKNTTKIYKIHDFVALRQEFKDKTEALLKEHGY